MTFTSQDLGKTVLRQVGSTRRLVTLLDGFPEAPRRREGSSPSGDRRGPAELLEARAQREAQREATAIFQICKRNRALRALALHFKDLFVGVEYRLFPWPVSECEASCCRKDSEFKINSGVAVPSRAIL